MSTPKTEFRSKRLARLFDETLASFPVTHRRVILERLVIAGDGLDLLPHNCSEFIAKQYGLTIERGYFRVLWLNQRALSSAPIGAVKSVIAHELAHVFLNHTTRTRTLWGAIKQEIAAKKQAATWGYEYIEDITP